MTEITKGMVKFYGPNETLPIKPGMTISFITDPENVTMTERFVVDTVEEDSDGSLSVTIKRED